MPDYSKTINTALIAGASLAGLYIVGRATQAAAAEVGEGLEEIGEGTSAVAEGVGRGAVQGAASIVAPVATGITSILNLPFALYDYLYGEEDESEGSTLAIEDAQASGDDG